jgi:hypothetical protein
VFVGVKVGVGGGGVRVPVGVIEGVYDGLGVGVIVLVAVGVPVFVGVPVSVGVLDSVGVSVGVSVAVAVGVSEGVGVEVSVGVLDGVEVGGGGGMVSSIMTMRMMEMLINGEYPTAAVVGAPKPLTGSNAPVTNAVSSVI